MYSPIEIWSRNRIYGKNKNIIFVINGETGSGKSYAAISFALILHTILKSNFSIQNNLDFNFGSLLHKMDLPINNKPGTIFIFEEVGAIGGGASSKEWQSQANRFFNSFLQTSRHRQQVIILTCPLFFNLEKSSRQLCHMQWSMESIDYVNKISYVTPFRLQTNKVTGKIYFKYIRYRINGENHCLTRYALANPPDDIIKEYESIKRKYTDRLNQRIKDSNIEKSSSHNLIDYIIVDALLKSGLKPNEVAIKCKCSTRAIEKYIKRTKSEANNAFYIGNQGIYKRTMAAEPST
jgi:hypothetical protein